MTTPARPSLPRRARAPAGSHRALALAFAFVLPATAGPAAAGEEPPADPTPAPRVEIDPIGAALAPGAVLRGRAVALGPGRHRVEWRDAGGTLASRDLDPRGPRGARGPDGSGERAFEFTLSYPRARVNEVVLSRLEGRKGRALSRASFEIALPAALSGLVRVLVPGGGGEAPDDFPAEAVLWRVADREEPPAAGGRALVIDLAVETLLSGPPPEVWGRQAVSRGTPSRDARVRVPCLNDPAFREAVREHARKFLSPQAARRAAAVSLGTGLSSTYRGAPYDFCTAPHCEAAFRAFLRERYGRFDALLRAWDVPLEGWEDARPLALEETGFPHARRYAAWADHLAFRDRTFAAFLEDAAKEVRALAPGAPVGFFGLGRPAAYGGADFELVGRAVDWRGAAWEPGARRLASAFLPTGGALASAPGPDARRALSGALAGERIVFLRPTDADAARALAGLSRGLGRLVELSAPPAPRPRGSDLANFATPRVALVWSQSSVRASFVVDSQALGLPREPGPRAPTETLVPPGVLDGGREGSWALAWEAWRALLTDLGVTFVCLSERDVARGDLVAKGFRAAVLVRQMGVPADAAREIQRFARAGGVVVADAGAGLFDGDATRAGPGALADVLGVRHGTVKFSEVGPKRAAIADRALRYVERPEDPSWFPHPGQLRVGPAQSGLALDGARAEGSFGDVPCLMVNAFGGGWGVTLNLALTPYRDLRLAPGGGEALRTLVRGVLARAGVPPAVELRYPDGTASPPAAGIREAGDLRLVVVRRDERGRRGGGTVRARLALRTDGPPAVHDTSAGFFVGWTRDLEVDLAPGEARVFALLPYRLRSIRVEPVGAPPDSARPGPESFEVSLRREGGGRWAPHVLELAVEDPDGRRRGEYARLVETSRGRTEFVVPFAESDPPGLWTVRLRERGDGLVAVRRFVH